MWSVCYRLTINRRSGGSKLYTLHSTLYTRKASQYFCAEDFVGGVALCVLHGTAVAAGEEEHLLVAQNLYEVVIEIARLLSIVQDDKE